MIKLENIYKTYRIGKREVHAVNGINLEIKRGELAAIIGASGSGKTTLMNILGLLDHPSEGHYFFNDKDIAITHRDERAYLRNHLIGFIFQQFFLLARKDALHNVMLPLSYRKNISTSEMKKQAMESLRKVSMDKFYNHRPNELSGGQQQRVAIARALIGQPSLILADEPTGALDSKTSQEVMNLLKLINKNEHATIIIVTHDPHIAQQCDRIIKISDGQIVED